MSKGFLLESFMLNPCVPSKPHLKQSFERLRDQRRDFRIEAGLRLYAQLLTKAWRKRCKKVYELNDTFQILKGASRKAAENLEWKNNAYFEQQYVNEELTCRLHVAQRDIAHDEKNIDELLTMVKSLEFKKQELLAEISKSSDKCINRNLQISDLKLKSMQLKSKTSLLEEELKGEKLKAQKLEENINKAAEKFIEYKAVIAQREELLSKEISKLDSEIQSTKIERKLLKTEVNDLVKLNADMEHLEVKNTDVSTNFEKRLLNQQVASLSRSLEKSFEHKFFKNFIMAMAIVVKAFKVILPAFPKRLTTINDDFETKARIGYVAACTHC